MQFTKCLLALALSAVLAEATEHSSVSINKETSKLIASKTSAAVVSHKTLQTAMKYGDYKYSYGDKDYDSSKTTQKYEKDHDTTKTTHETTKTHASTKVTHTSSLHSIHLYTAHHNSSTVLKGSMKNLMTSTATSAAMMSATEISKSTATVMHSAPTMAADTTMMQLKSTAMSFDVFTMSSCADCVTAPIETGLITASVSAQDFTMGMSATSVLSDVIATPASIMQSTMITAMASATTSAPSAGFATTSRAVFTGSGRRQTVDYLLVGVLPALAYAFTWF